MIELNKNNIFRDMTFYQDTREPSFDDNKLITNFAYESMYHGLEWTPQRYAWP